HQALLRRHARAVRQARPGLPARDRRRRYRGVEGHVRAPRQGSGVPARRRQPQSGSGDRGARGRADRARRLHPGPHAGLRGHRARRRDPRRSRVLAHRRHAGGAPQLLPLLATRHGPHPPRWTGRVSRRPDVVYRLLPARGDRVTDAAIERLDDVRMDEVRLTTAVADAELARLKLGDVVYLDGVVYTARESVYRRVVDEGVDLPASVRALTNVNFHCSPAATVRPDGTYAVEAVTATASFRFGKSMSRWFERSGASVIVGKAGLTELAYREWFVPHGAVYLTTVGYGLGAAYGRCIKR